MSKDDCTRDYAVRLLEKMVEIDSPSGEESRLASFLESEMLSLGYDVQIDEMGNVLGRMGFGGPTILLCGHMDTIPLKIAVSSSDGCLYGRGTVDAKASLAAMIVSAKQLIDEGFKGSVLIACTVQEEGDNRGIRAITMSGVKADYAVFGEPTNTRTLTFAYKGCLTLRIRCLTEPGHSSAPWLHENAIEKSMEVYDVLRKATTTLSAVTEGFDALTICIRAINGGQNIGVIPSECSTVIEFRVPPSVEIIKLKERINQNIEAYIKENPKIKILHKFMRSVEPFRADKKSLLVQAFSRTIYEKFKERVILVKKSGVGDMSYYGKAFNTPVITYGPGNSHLSHTIDEHIKIDEYLLSIEILKASLFRLEQLHNK